MPHIFHLHHIGHNLFDHMLCFLSVQIAIKKVTKFVTNMKTSDIIRDDMK